MNATMLARMAHEAARAAHYDGYEMPAWEREAPEARRAAVAISEAVLSGKADPEQIFPGDDLGQRVLRALFLSALPAAPEESPETDDERAARLALEKRNRIVSPHVTAREKPGECIVTQH